MTTPKTILGLAGTIVGGAVVVTIAALLLSNPGSNATPLSASVSGSTQTPQGTLTHAFLNLDTYPDSMAGEHGASGGPHPDWVSYGPSTNLHVPAHALVTVTIKQYDSGGTIINPFFAKVHGTVGGTAIVNGKTRTGINPNDIGHTFTLHAAPTNQTPLFVSVPLPALPDSATPAPGALYPTPNVVTFSFITGSAGKYVWNCEFPCGDGFYQGFGGPMSTRGYMSGTLTVG